MSDQKKDFRAGFLAGLCVFGLAALVFLIIIWI